MLSDFCFNDTAPTEIYTLSLHDALPISLEAAEAPEDHAADVLLAVLVEGLKDRPALRAKLLGEGLATVPLLSGRGFERAGRSEEHTSELQSQSNLVCRLLLEKKKKKHQL